jgi:hypothetical protein
MNRFRTFGPLLACGVAVVAAGALGIVAVDAQGQQFQFIIAAEPTGAPITDLKPEEVTMSENGMPAKVLKVEPYPVPVRLTITVDNGPDSPESIAHMRTGLTAMVEALPPDVEVTLVSTAPQPRMVVRPTKDRAEILRGVNRFSPESSERPRFTDALVEWAQRLEKDYKSRKVADFVPVGVMLSTTANEQSAYQVREIEQAMGFLAARKARVFVTIFSGKQNNVTAIGDLDTNRQALIAIPLTKATNGRFETLAASSRLATLLPEFGQTIANLHQKHANQMRVTVQRPDGISGNLQNPDIRITRPGVNGSVSLDGL